MTDTRNVVDKYKGKPIEAIISDLDLHGSPLEIAIDNVERDFNMGTIVRSANAFGVRAIHVIGRRQWNKRGAMMTDKYLRVVYHGSIDDFFDAVKDRAVIAVDNIAGSIELHQADLPRNVVLVFGAEATGIRPEIIERSQQMVAIEQFGSTRSLNVGVAAGVAMYEWTRRHIL